MAIDVLQFTGATRSGSGATQALAFVSNVTAGNRLVVCVARFQGGAGDGTVTDSQGNTYTKHISEVTSANQTSQIWSAIAGASGACTVTLTPPSATRMAMGIAEVSGTVSVGNTVHEAGGGSATITPGQITVAHNAILFATLRKSTSATINCQTGWTQIYEDESSTNVCNNSMYMLTPVGDTPLWGVSAADAGHTCVGVAFESNDVTPTLPLTGLTAHYRAQVTTELFKTFDSSGIHTGTPVDGDAVQVWDNFAGTGSLTQMLRYHSSTTTSPLFRSTTPLMLHSCLDFNGSRRQSTFNQTAGATRVLSSYINNNAFTLIVAVYPQGITTTNANVYNTEPVIADVGQFWGLFFRLVSGVPKVAGYNWDGTEDVITMTITTGHTWIVVFQHTGGNLKLSLIDENGVETSATNVASGNTTTLTNQISLGQILTAFGNFRIGEFAIWNTDLSGGSDLANAKAWFKDNWLDFSKGKPVKPGDSGGKKDPPGLSKKDNPRGRERRELQSKLSRPYDPFFG